MSSTLSQNEDNTGNMSQVPYQSQQMQPVVGAVVCATCSGVGCAQCTYHYNNAQQQQQQQQQQRQNDIGRASGTLGEKGACKVGKLCFGIPLYVHYLLPLLGAFYIASTLTRYMNTNVAGQAVLMTFLVYCIVLPLTVLIHELGHCTGAILTKTPVYKILLWPLGGLAYMGFSDSRKKDFLIIIAGPVTHIPLFLLFVGLTALDSFRVLSDKGDTDEEFYKDNFFVNFCVKCQWLQVVLCVFNLFLPAYPLDGGRILVILLTNCCSPVTTAWVAITVCCVICTGIVGYTGFLVVSTGCYFCYLFNFLIVAWILFQTYGVYACIKSGSINLHPFFNPAVNQ